MELCICGAPMVIAFAGAASAVISAKAHANISAQAYTTKKPGSLNRVPGRFFIFANLVW